MHGSSHSGSSLDLLTRHKVTHTDKETGQEQEITEGGPEVVCFLPFSRFFGLNAWSVGRALETKYSQCGLHELRALSAILL